MCVFKNNNDEAINHTNSSESKSKLSEKHWKNWTDSLSNIIQNKNFLLFLHTKSALFRSRKSLTCELKSHYCVKSFVAVIYSSNLTLIQ
jgi:hypothetical protein